MVIDNKFLDNLLEQAANSERKRTAFDMRTTSADNSQCQVQLCLSIVIQRHQNR